MSPITGLATTPRSPAPSGKATTTLPKERRLSSECLHSNHAISLSSKGRGGLVNQVPNSVAEPMPFTSDGERKRKRVCMKLI